jgi:hypothetical protein
MRVYFESNKDTKSFLNLCKIITKVIEENEKFKNQKF